MKTRRQLLQELVDRRLAQIDTTAKGNLLRALRFNERRRVLSRSKIYGAFIYPTRPNRMYTYAVVGPVYSYH